MNSLLWRILAKGDVVSLPDEFYTELVTLHSTLWRLMKLKDNDFFFSRRATKLFEKMNHCWKQYKKWWSSISIQSRIGVCRISCCLQQKLQIWRHVAINIPNRYSCLGQLNAGKISTLIWCYFHILHQKATCEKFIHSYIDTKGKVGRYRLQSSPRKCRGIDQWYYRGKICRETNFWIMNEKGKSSHKRLQYCRSVHWFDLKSINLYANWWKC